MTNQDALVLIFSRNAFYRHLHFLSLGVLVLIWMAIIGLIFMLSFLWQNPPRPLYFPTDDVGRLIQNVPVNTPNMSPQEVRNWVQEAVVSATSYDYINYRAQLQSAQKYFTNYGWSNYMKGLALSNNILALTERKQIVTAKVLGDMKLLAQGILGGGYAWKYQMALLITFQTPPYDGSGKASSTNAWSATVIVRRLSELEGYKGMGILQLILEEASESTLKQIQSISNQSTG